MNKIVEKLIQCWKGTSMSNADLMLVAQTIHDMAKTLRKELDEIQEKLDKLASTQVDLKNRVELLEKRPPEVHNHYHSAPEQPWYQPPIRYGNGTGDFIPPPNVTSGKR